MGDIMGSWTDHLKEDELPWVAAGDETLRTVLMRLAYQRALYERMADEWHADIVATHRDLSDGPDDFRITEEEEADIQADFAKMRECEDRGGCQWRLAEDERSIVLFGGFPAETCDHCGTSRLVNWKLPPPP
jgi:hypothetical protein